LQTISGADKSGVSFDSEWRSVEREEIKAAVRDRKVRLLVATDAACEGLNLQTLGTLIKCICGGIRRGWNSRPHQEDWAGASEGGHAEFGLCGDHR